MLESEWMLECDVNSAIFDYNGKEWISSFDKTLFADGENLVNVK